MTTATQLVTAEQLFEMGDIGRCELIRGEIIHMPPAGAEHGSTAIEIAYRIKSFVDEHRLGRVFAAETGFTIARRPDTTRAPDVAFVRKQRLPDGPIRGFFNGPPDLAVEVISPSDRLSEVTAKVDEWLAAGAVSVWVIDPPNRAIAIYRAGNRVERYRDGDEVTGEPTLPGFRQRVADLFTA